MFAEEFEQRFLLAARERNSSHHHQLSDINQFERSVYTRSASIKKDNMNIKGDKSLSMLDESFEMVPI